MTTVSRGIGKTWPWLEAKSIIAKNQNKLPDKGYVLFQAGYGPSGLPHLGTFAEVLRTSIVMNAYQEMTGHPCRLQVFSDDMDGFRKVPSNLPKQEMLASNIDKPLSLVTDPFDQCSSLGEFNNRKLMSFLDQFDFEYDFVSATDCYKSGKFNSTLSLFLKNHQKILDLVLPEIGEDRQKSYSPFLPISKKSNKVLQTKVLEINLDQNTITFLDEDNEKQTTSIHNGEVKLQWKADWAMRWVAFDVDYEMAGKDLISSKVLSGRITKALNHRPPVGFNYEHFLDESGEKISKSKGNGLSMDEWLRYGQTSSLSYFLFQKPKTAKRISFNQIPLAANNFHSELLDYRNLKDEQKLDSAIYHIKHYHKEIAAKIDNFKLKLDYNLLLNLATVCRAEKPEVLLLYLEKYYPDLNDDEKSYLNEIAKNIVNYYQDFVKNNLTYTTPDKKMLIGLDALYNKLSDDMSDQEIQQLVYDCGNDSGYESLRVWFQNLYKCLLGQESGPRLGGFFKIYGIENSKKLIKEAKSRVSSNKY